MPLLENVPVLGDVSLGDYVAIKLESISKKNPWQIFYAEVLNVNKEEQNADVRYLRVVRDNFVISSEESVGPLCNMVKMCCMVANSKRGYLRISEHERVKAQSILLQ